MRCRLTHTTGTDAVGTTQQIRNAVDEAFRNRDRIESLPPLKVITVDHYNSKWTVAAIEWLRRRRIVDHILDRPRRICIQVLESGMLPRGRFQFYNGVGGALADMIGHIIQPLRALSGHATVKALLATMKIVEIKRARYDVAEDFLLDAFGTRPVEREALAAKLSKDTETFGVIKLEFVGPPWNGTPVYIRTGKGFLAQSKTMIVEGFDDDGPVALVCDIDNRRICLADRGPQRAVRNEGHDDTILGSLSDKLPDRVWMWTREFDVPGLTHDRFYRSGASEYVEVFSALCGWETPDSRFFPPVEDASYACDFFYGELIRDRINNPNGLVESNVYPADYYGGEVRSWLDSDAGWAQLGIETNEGD